MTDQNIVTKENLTRYNDNLKTKVNEKLALKVDRTVKDDNNATNIIDNQKAQMGCLMSTMLDDNDTIISFNTASENGADGILGQIYAKSLASGNGMRLNFTKTGAYYGVGSSTPIDADHELAVIGDFTASENPSTATGVLTAYSIKLGDKVWNLPTSSGGTLTDIKMNGSSVSITSGVADLGTVITAHQDISGKLDKNADITAGTKSKLTYDSKGLITAGADLEATDIPELASSKLTAMTGYSKASSASAILVTDSLNTAVGKLEYKVDNVSVPTITLNGAATTTPSFYAVTTAGTENSYVYWDNTTKTLKYMVLPGFTKLIDNATGDEINAMDPATLHEGDTYICTVDSTTAPNKYKDTAYTWTSTNTWVILAKTSVDLSNYLEKNLGVANKDKVVITDSAGDVKVSSIDSSKLAYLGTITSDVQTQLDNKASSTQLTDGSVTKVGTANVGTATKPIYLANGVPTAGSYTLGTACEKNVASAIASGGTDLPTSGLIYSYAANNLVVKNTAITPGEACKIYYDAKGLVTGGDALSADDVPALAISKITDLQTTLDGKVPKPATALTSATKCKITYDTNGLITAGSNLSQSDLPKLTGYAIASTQANIATTDTILVALGKLEKKVNDILANYVKIKTS